MKRCKDVCEQQRTDNIKPKNILKEFLLSNISYSNQKQLSLVKLNSFLSSLFFHTSFLDDKATFSERVYVVLNNINSLKLCEYCNEKSVKYKNYTEGYFHYCSSSCSFNATKEDRKITNLNKYGSENTFQVEESIQKRNLRMKEKKVHEKAQQTKNDRYGKERTSIYKKVRKNWKKKNKDEIKSITEKRNKTKIDKYGENYLYDFNKKSSETKMKNTIERKLLLLDKLNIKPLFSIDEYRGVSDEKYLWECQKCKLHYSKSLDNGKIPYCPKCSSLNGTFNGELDVINYIKSLDIKVDTSNRKIIKPLEIDLLIGNLGIEYDGLYYHSYERLNEEKSNSQFIKDNLIKYKLNKNIGKSYHLLKTLLSKDKGINLIHIFEDEWNDIIKQDIWKSIINNKLHLNKIKINARDCYIKEISSQEKNLFLDKNHLQGKDNSSIRLGLFIRKSKDGLKENTLVSVMTFGKSRYDKTIDKELYRFCNLKYVSVRGAASKLLAHFKRNFKCKSLVSYGDRRFGFDNFYISIGFSKVDSSIPGYKYIKGSKSYGREMFQKYKIKEYYKRGKYGISSYEESLTGEENMLINGYKKIYDCGNNKYVIYF